MLKIFVYKLYTPFTLDSNQFALYNQALPFNEKRLVMTFHAEIKILDPRIGVDELLPMPEPATIDSAGMDLRVCTKGAEGEPLVGAVVLKAGESALFGTGLAIYLQDADYVGMVYPRSGLGSKHGIVLGNLVGVIDADYQGELLVCLWNRSQEDYTINLGERIAQYVVTPVVKPNFAIVKEFSDATDRGAGGFGSTGK